MQAILLDHALLMVIGLLLVVLINVTERGRRRL
jgi:hypothetical protein